MTMSSSEQPSDHDSASALREPSNNGCRNASIGCGFIILLTVALLFAGREWLGNRAKNLAADVVVATLIQNVEASELPQNEKQRIAATMNAIKDDYKAERISDDQLHLILKKIGERPIVLIGMLRMIPTIYIEPSGLPEDERLEALRTLQRYERGCVEKRISDEQIAAAMKHLQEQPPATELKQVATDVELRAFLSQLKTDVDTALIPDEPFRCDMAKELDDVIDSVRNPPANER